jgi:hypothetical protein
MSAETIAVNSPSALRLSWAWRFLLLAILFLSAIASSRQVIYYWTHGPVVSDLRIFRTGWEMLRSGQGHRLYRFDAQEKTQIRLYPEVRSAGAIPFNHLAYELLFYWPFLELPDRAALIAWAWLNVILVFAIARLMSAHTQAIRDATGIPVAAYLLAFYPLLYVLGQGQDSLVFLFLVVLSWRCSEKNFWFLGGFVLALALFKFHLALAIAFFVLLLRRQWRAVGGFAAGGILVMGISRLMAGPNFPADYISMLRNQETITPWGFVPWFMPNLRGLLQWFFARWLDIGTILPIILLASLVVGALTTWILFRSRSPQEALVYSAAISSTILLSYHLHMQDLSLALLPMLLLLDHGLRHKLPHAATISVMAAAAGLYLYRIAALIAPILLIRGCVLALPIILLWLAGMSAVAIGDGSDRISQIPSRSQAMN